MRPQVGSPVLNQAVNLDILAPGAPFCTGGEAVAGTLNPVAAIPVLESGAAEYTCWLGAPLRGLR